MSDFGDDNDLSRFGDASSEDRLKPIDVQAPPSVRVREAAPFPPVGKSAPAAAAPGLDVAPGELTFVKRGDYVDLLRKDPTLRQIYIAIGWEHSIGDDTHVDVDLSCFLVDRTNQTREDSDFVFYNNDKAHDGAIKIREDSRTGAGDGDDEAIFIDLNGVPFEIIKLVFTLTLYDENLDGYHFGMIRSLYMRVVNRENNEEIVRLPIERTDDLIGNNALIAANIVREGPRWFFEPIIMPSKGGLAELAKGYGIIVREDTG